MTTLSDRTTRAARWRIAGSAVAAVSQLVVGVLLARLLAPADFGLVALALVVLGFVQPLGDLGLGSAIVQKAALTDRHIRAAFTLALLLGLAISVVVAVAAPTIAALVGDPRVPAVLRVLSAGFALRGAAVVAEALLRRRLDFRSQFFIDTGSHVIGYGGVAVALALLGFGVWSLVWGGVLQTLLASAAQIILVRHSMRPLWDRRELTDLLDVGVGAALSGWVSYLALNGDNFVVGRLMGAASLGLYGRAYALMNLPFTYVSGAMTGVLFPAFALVQGEPARLRRGYLLVTRLTALIAAPSMGTLAVAAPHLVPALYGSQWAGVVAPLQILCVAGYFRALYHPGGIVLRSIGRVYTELSLQVVYAGLVLGGTWMAARHGLPWVAIAVSTAIVCMFFTTAALALRATGARWDLYLDVQRSGVVTGAVTCVVAVCMRLILEALQAASGVIALGVLGAAAVPWSLGILRDLDRPEYDPLRANLPGWCQRRAASVVVGASRVEGFPGVSPSKRDVGV